MWICVATQFRDRSRNKFYFHRVIQSLCLGRAIFSCNDCSALSQHVWERWHNMPRCGLLTSSCVGATSQVRLTDGLAHVTWVGGWREQACEYDSGRGGGGGLPYSVVGREEAYTHTQIHTLHAVHLSGGGRLLREQKALFSRAQLSVKNTSHPKWMKGRPVLGTCVKLFIMISAASICNHHWYSF